MKSNKIEATTGPTSAAPGVTDALAHEVAGAANSWMKLISSTFLGEQSLFSSRKPPMLTVDNTPRVQHQRMRNGFDHPLTFKIALVGGSGVGKTTIVRRWLQRSYPSTYSPTIGVDVHTMNYKYRGEEVLLHLWDVSSVEADSTQSSLHSLICDGLGGIFFVFNVHRVSSIAAIDKWRHNLAKFISAMEIPCFLLSHKADMIQKRIMASDDIASYVKAGGYRAWMWTVGRPSFGENEKHPAVMEALERMVDQMWQNRDTRPNPSAPIGILDSREGAQELPIIHVDQELHEFSAALLRIPTRAITTLPRDENLLPIEETFEQQRQSPHRHGQPRGSIYGGEWILGQDRGAYLHVTDDSVVTDHPDTESDVDAEEKEDHDDTPDSCSTTDQRDGTVIETNSTNEQVDAQAVESSHVDVHDVVQEEQPSPSTESSDDDAWRFFAGSISRHRSEEILSGREEGTFLLRRKDAQTLVLSYVGPQQVHHALIEYANQRYHVGSAKSSQASFSSLYRCLRSVRKYAHRGLIFTRNVEFRVVNKEEMALTEEHNPPRSPVSRQAVPPGHNASVWRSGKISSSSGTPRTQQGASPRHPASMGGLQATQEHVQIPPKARVDELCASFYDQLAQRLRGLSFDPTKEAVGGVSLPSLLELVEEEQKALEGMPSKDTEVQWRQLVKNMELWSRIILNLEVGVNP